MFVLSLIGMVVSGATIAYDAIAKVKTSNATLKYKTALSKINELARKVQDAINADSTLLSQLQHAYSTKDAKLAQDLLYASPVSGSYQKLLGEMKQLQRDYTQHKDLLEGRIKENSSQLNELNKDSADVNAIGSLLNGSISGSEKAAEKLDDFESKVTENSIITGGTENVQGWIQRQR